MDKEAKKTGLANLALPAQGEAPLSPPTHRYTYLLATALALLAFAVYLPSLGNDFVWDDLQYLSENRHLRSLDLAFCKWAFFNFYAANWHPLTWISHGVDHALWGGRPGGHRLGNLLLHAANTALVALLATRLLVRAQAEASPRGGGSFLSGRMILVAAGSTALLFGIHPLHVESVVWLAERKDLLCGLFYLLALLVHAGETPNSAAAATETGRFSFLRRKRYWETAFFFLLALLSKPMAVTLPLVLLLLDWYPLRRISSPRSLLEAVREKLPLLALSLASSLLTILAQRAEGAMAALGGVPFPARILLAAHSLVAYLGLMAPPFPLLPLYPYPEPNSIVLGGHYLLALLLAGAITTLAALLARRHKVFLAAWSYYLITLLPVLGLIQVGAQAMADRYTYLPSLGPFLIAGLGASWLNEQARQRLGVKFSRQLPLGLLALGIALFLALATHKQIGVWRNEITLWSHLIQLAPEGSHRAYNNRGAAYLKQGQLKSALADFEQALRMRPDYPDALFNRGIVRGKMGESELARSDFQRARALGRRPAPPPQP